MTPSLAGVDRGARFRWDATVPEYDAFGREIGENTLSGLGGSETQQPQPQAEPAPPPPSEGFTEAAPAEPKQITFSVPEGAPVTVAPSGRRRRAGGLGCLVALLILGVVVAGPVIAIVSFVDEASDVIGDVTDAVDSDTIPDLVQPDAPAPPPTGIAGRSLIAQDNLRGALREIEQAGFTRLTRIVVWPERLSASVVKGGRQRDLEVTYEGDLDRGTPRPANAASPSFALSSLDPAAPARLVRGSAKRYRVKPKGVYVIAQPEVEPGNHHWRAYFKNGIYVEGDAKGRVIGRFDGG
jgi:hypothetical protein